MNRRLLGCTRILGFSFVDGNVVPCASASSGFGQRHMEWIELDNGNGDEYAPKVFCIKIRVLKTFRVKRVSSLLIEVLHFG